MGTLYDIRPFANSTMIDGFVFNPVLVHVKPLAAIGTESADRIGGRPEVCLTLFAGLSNGWPPPIAVLDENDPVFFTS